MPYENPQKIAIRETTQKRADMRAHSVHTKQETHDQGMGWAARAE